MIDWFYVSAGVVVGCQLLFGCFSLMCAAKLLAVLAIIRFVIIPADCDLTLWFYEHFGKPVESLKGQVVWITGASTGIGAALAVRLARSGVKLALSARTTEKLEEVKKQCVATGGVGENDVLVVPLDMTNYSKHQSTFDQILAHFGQLDILVNNAGRTQRGRWERIDLQVDRELFDLNVFSLIALSRMVIKYFLQRGSGHVAVTSSVAGKLGAPMSSSYTGSKHALQGYFDCLRMEKAGSGLRVTMVCPGPVESNILNIGFTEKPGEVVGESRVGRLMSSERCADLFAVSLANQLNEVWISEQPVLLLVYATQYFPAITTWCLVSLSVVGYIMKLRDGKNVLKEGEKKQE